MTKDTRPPWQIAIAIRLQSAISYLRLLELNAHKQQVYETVYKTGSLEQWVNEHVDRIIAIVNQTIEVHRQGCVVTMDKHRICPLVARGLSGVRPEK